MSMMKLHHMAGWQSEYDLACFACLLIFFKINFFKKKYFRNTVRVSNSFDPDQDRHSVGPDLGPNCLQRLSAYHKSYQFKELGVRLYEHMHLLDKIQHFP